MLLSKCRSLVFKAYGITENTGPEAPLPMGLPTSLNRAALPVIWGTAPQYVVSPKADGRRVVVGFLTQTAFTLDRANTGKHFPSWQPHEAAWQGTVLDVEWVTTPQRRRILWIFDALMIHGHSVRSKPYHHRLAAAQLFLDEWQRARRLSTVPWPHEAPGALPHTGAFLVLDPHTYWSIKPLWYHTEVASALQWSQTLGEWLPQDGLVYTPVTRSAPVFRSLDVYKWKPVERQTVDFLVRRVEGDPTRMDLLVVDEHNQLQTFASVPLRSDQQELRAGLVYECRWDQGSWVIHLARSDKKEPNAFFTAKRTCDDILENLQWTELVPPGAERTGQEVRGHQ